MTKQLIESIMEEFIGNTIWSNNHGTRAVLLEDIKPILEKHLSLPKQEETPEEISHIDTGYEIEKIRRNAPDKKIKIHDTHDMPKVEQEDATPIQELKKEIEQAQRNREVRTAIWSIYDFISKQTNE